MAIGTQTLVSGSRTTYGVSANNQHIRDVEDKIQLLKPFKTPLDAWYQSDNYLQVETKGIRGKHEWYEDAFLPSITTLGTGGITGGAATQASVAVAANIFRVDQTVIVESSNQLLLVTAVGSGTIDLRTPDASNITAAVAGVNIQVLSPAHAEGGSKTTSMTTVAANKSAYPQIIKKLLSMTGTQRASAFYGGGDWKYQWVKAAMECREEMERTFYNAGAGYDEGASTGRTYMTGCNSFTTNIFTYTTSLSKTVFDAAIKQTMTNGSTDSLIALCGSGALNDVAAFIQGLHTIAQQTPELRLKTFGLLTTSPEQPKMVGYVHPQGIVDVMYAPNLKGRYANEVILLNPEQIKKLYMGAEDDGTPRKYRVEMNIQTPGDDKTDSQYMYHQGQKIGLEESHGRIRKT